MCVWQYEVYGVAYNGSSLWISLGCESGVEWAFERALLALRLLTP